MNKTLLGCGLFLVVGGVLAAMVAGGTYNRLVGQEEGVKSAWAQVENVYQRRADLIPNLVNTVRGAKDFEQETLQAVVEARSKVGQTNLSGAPSADQLSQFQASQDGLSSATRSSRRRKLFAICNPSSKAPRIASPWSASDSMRSPKPTMPAARSFRQSWSPA